ncbi:PIN-like domain-containing protein [Bacillus thuringiensis]|uniref:PIN-like domain-containing protein n=1 Tax=Bacillus thuringiensis TaxID=1428 RepID=UPI000BF3EB6B|nr:PIN-like domain-containing protein [Bacillus thuringiensis]PFJ57020.1 hypothetical protein COJ10_28245 [Bacillus thuringiensis]
MQNEFDKLFIETNSLNKMMQSAKIVIDTNVLLSAYQTKPVTFDAIFEVLQELSNSGRLIVPSHVIWEFSKNRPNRIKEISNNLHQHIDSLEKVINISQPKELTKILPAIGVLEEKHFDEIIKLQTKFKNKIKELRKVGQQFKDGLRDLSINIGDYIDNDPILLKYKNILSKSKLEVDVPIGEKELEEEGKKRFKQNIPPGFRDSEKGFNKYGDLVIWLEICELKEDIIFITFDNKPDWVYKDSKDNVLGARRELVLEYYEKSEGKSFKILHPGKFVELYREGKVPKEVKDELQGYRSTRFKNINHNVFVEEQKSIDFLDLFTQEQNNDEEMLLWKRIKVLERKIEDIIGEISEIVSNEEKMNFEEITSKYYSISIFNHIDQNTLGENISYETQITDIYLDLQKIYKRALKN